MAIDSHDHSSVFFRLGALGALGVVMATSPAFAQQTDGATVATTNEAGEDVVVVQARKREESIQEVPVAVTTIGEEDAADLVLEDVTDYIRQTPGATLVAAGPAYLNDLALRGQGGGRLGFTESTTGIYRDGHYVAGGGFGGRTYSKIDFFDIQTMEVYRGPQGALYGRNAVGGAANIITNKPEDVFGLRLKAGYSDLDQVDLSAVANLPIVDGVLNARVGGYFSERDDGFHHVDTTGEALDKDEDWGLRGVLQWYVDDASELLLTIEDSHSEAPGFASLGFNTTIDPDPYTRTGLDIIDSVVIDQTSLYGQYDRELGVGDLTILATYKTREGDRDDGDLDHFLGFNSPALSLVDEQSEEFERYGLEARLASKNTSGVTWLAGADFQTYTSDVVSERTGTFAGPFAASAALRNVVRRDESSEELVSFSAFGLIGFDISDRLNLSLEARIQNDEKDFDFERIDLDAFTDSAIPLTSFSQSSTRFLPSISVLYRLTDNQNLYGRIASGYRPGGFNPQPPNGFFDQTPFGPETAYSAEAGWKTFGRYGDIVFQTDLGVFYTYTDDILTQTSLTTLATVAALQNVGDAAIYGAEFSARASAPLWGGRARGNLGLSTADGEFRDGTSVIFNGVTYDLGGYRTPRNRDYTLNLNLAYSHPVSTDVDGFVSTSVQAEGGGFDNAVGELRIANSRSSDHFEMFDARIGLRDQTGASQHMARTSRTRSTGQ